MNTFIGFIMGLIIGNIIGIFLVCLMIAGSDR